MNPLFAGLDLKGLVATEEGSVVLPSLQSAKTDLQCCWGWPAAAAGILRDLLPVSENAAATLSLLGRRISHAEAGSALHEERQPGFLANRLSLLRRRVRSPKPGRRAAEREVKLETQGLEDPGVQREAVSEDSGVQNGLELRTSEDVEAVVGPSVAQRP